MLASNIGWTIFPPLFRVVLSQKRSVVTPAALTINPHAKFQAISPI